MHGTAAAQTPGASTPVAQSKPAKTDVAGAFADSFKLLFIEHATRLALQPKTRRELSGRFWREYQRSVHMPIRWEDTDKWPVNYIGHPIHGAAAGYVWIAHRESGADEIFGMTPRYWASRGRAAAWAAAYSLQFEIGPISEASIGNVGLHPETTGWVDYVVTPAGAFGLVVAEDALDRFFVGWAERRIHNRVARASLRMLFSPSRTLANLAAGKSPWSRPDRPIGWRN